jgi:hypothetical protein
MDHSAIPIELVFISIRWPMTRRESKSGKESEKSSVDFRQCLQVLFPRDLRIVKYHDMNRTALIDQIQQATETLEKLLSLLQSAPVERDRFVSHLYQSRREYRRTCENAGKSGKRIERCVISSFQIAESMGFKGEFRQWEDLLRVGD